MRILFTLLLMALIAESLQAQFVFKDEKDAQKGIQYAYVGGSLGIAHGADMAAVYTVGTGLETGLAIAIIKNLTIEPRGLIHYFANFPNQGNYNDNLWLWNFGFNTAYQFYTGQKFPVNISPIVSVGYMGGLNVISFPYSGRSNLKLMRLQGITVSPGILLERNQYFIRASYEIFMNQYELDPQYQVAGSNQNPSKPYGPIVTPGDRPLNMNYINLTLGYQFDFFK